jgi:polyphosphate kinase
MVYFGSADLMPRNLNRRVEVLCPVEDPGLIRHLRDVLLERYLQDNIKGHMMSSDRTYRKISNLEPESEEDVQSWFIKHYHSARLERV